MKFFHYALRTTHYAFNERGFMLLSAVFLTLIVSFTAALTLQAVTLKNKDETALELTAINLANEQFAMVESLAAQDKLSDVKNFNGKSELPEGFEVKTNVEGGENLREVTVTVTWQDEEHKFTKLVRIVKSD